MKYLILGDIHSNLEAFESVLEKASELNYDKVICTGDVIGYGASPSECLELLKTLPLEIYIGGNHEEQMFASERHMNSRAMTALKYSKEHLSEEQIDWIYNNAFWSKTFGNKCAVAHGGYYNPLNFPYLCLSDYDRRLCHGFMIESDLQTLFVGHSHFPSFMPKDEKGYPVYPGIDFIDLKNFKSAIVDVGSVGQPRDCNPDSAFVLYDSDENTVTRYRVPYDIEKAAKKIVSAGLPDSLAERLRYGK